MRCCWQHLAALACLLCGGAAAYRVDDAMADHTAAAIDFAEAGDMASAVASFRAAAAFTPDVPEHWYNLAEALADEDWEGSTAAAARKEAAAAGEAAADGDEDVDTADPADDWKPLGFEILTEQPEVLRLGKLHNYQVGWNQHHIHCRHRTTSPSPPSHCPTASLRD